MLPWLQFLNIPILAHNKKEAVRFHARSKAYPKPYSSPITKQSEFPKIIRGVESVRLEKLHWG